MELKCRCKVPGSPGTATLGHTLDVSSEAKHNVERGCIMPQTIW